MLTRMAKWIQRPKAGHADPESRAASSTVEQLFTQHLLYGMQSASGIRVTPLRALGVATVYACVARLATTLSTLPLNVYRRLPNGDKELDPSHHLHDLLHVAPNELMSSTEWRLCMEGNRALRNNAYSIIQKNNTGEVIAIHPVQPMDVQKTSGVVYQFADKTYDFNSVLHFKGLTQDGISGTDLLHTVQDVIGLAIALEENASKFFRNNSRPGGVLSHPGILSDDAFKRLSKQMEERHAGVENAYKLMILEEGLKYEASRADNRDSQFDESRERQDRAICRIFGIPPHKVGLVDNQPRANVEQDNLSFVVDTIRPLCVLWEQQLNLKLLSPEQRRTHFIEFNLSGLLRGDMKTRYASYAQARQWGWLNVNEIRRMENLNSIGAEGDVYLQPLNMESAGQPNPENNEE